MVVDDYWSSCRKRKHLLCWPCILWIYNKSIYFYTPRDVLCYFFTLRIAWLHVCRCDTCHKGVKIRVRTDGHTDYFHSFGQMRLVEVVKPKIRSWMRLCLIQPGWIHIKSSDLSTLAGRWSTWERVSNSVLKIFGAGSRLGWAVIMSLLKVSCGVFMETNKKYFKLCSVLTHLFIYPCLPACRIVPCLCRCIAAYLCAFQPPVDQWDSVKSLCIASSAHTFRCVLMHMHKTAKTHTFKKEEKLHSILLLEVRTPQRTFLSM